MDCTESGCDHVQYRGYDVCACHMQEEVYETFAHDDLRELVGQALLEMDEIELLSDGKARLLR